MANAKDARTPMPKNAGQPHDNKAPFSPMKLEQVAPGGDHTSKGTVASYLGGDECEQGQAKKMPVWP